MLGFDEVVWNLAGSEGAFRRAWNQWPYSYVFPSIRVDVARSDLKRILEDERSPARPSRIGLDWGGAVLPVDRRR
jgi:hypothetical protein